MVQYPAIVAAAGGSSRCPEGKLLKLWRGKPLLAWLLDRLSACGSQLGPIIVVTGHRPDRIEKLAAQYPGVSTIHNPRWSEGLSSSLQIGESCLSNGYGFLVALGDTPLFKGSTLRSLLPLEPSSEIRVPTFHGHRGHPVFFPEWIRERWSKLEGDRGARLLMELYANHVVEIPVDDPGILRDFDEAGDFEEAS